MGEPLQQAPCQTASPSPPADSPFRSLWCDETSANRDARACSSLFSGFKKRKTTELGQTGGCISRGSGAAEEAALRTHLGDPRPGAG